MLQIVSESTFIKVNNFAAEGNLESFSLILCVKDEETESQKEEMICSRPECIVLYMRSRLSFEASARGWLILHPEQWVV